MLWLTQAEHLDDLESAQWVSAGYGSHKGGKGGVIRGSVLGRVGGHIVLCHLPWRIRTGKSSLGNLSCGERTDKS